MNEQLTVPCPNCGTPVPISEALAAPIISAERARADAVIRQHNAEIANREQELQARAKQLELERTELASKTRDLSNTVTQLAEEQRATIAAAEAKRLDGEYQARLDSARQHFKQQAAQIADLQAAELAIRKQNAELIEQALQADLAVARRVDEERESIRQQAISAERMRNRTELDEKERLVNELSAQLTEAKEAELQVRAERTRLENQAASLKLEVARQVDAERASLRESAMRQQAEADRLKLAEKDKVIEDMRTQVEELRRKSEQGSQQLQGEVQELAIEQALRQQFPSDTFEPVPNGCSGGDLLQTVVNQHGISCGTILWEVKRTAKWQPNWLTKLREDQRQANASVCAIVSKALPKGIEAFDRIDQVWVSASSYVVPLATALRFVLIETAATHVADQDRLSKTERMYTYISGPNFHMKVAAIFEGVEAERAQLSREKRWMSASWAEREKHVELIQRCAAELVGDLRGILGNSSSDVEVDATPSIPPSLELPGDTTADRAA
ncbi:MAG: DUF2130 domain-containing protein [Acidobacteria bacterium]|nr:DUF2130 domain-containing protein [Acidobacteriota bacterium]